ncbi:TetR/AcrR family transcriptional regulator [Stenoxybacter acetivorans]|uniref:TetR/AcrR family transcriptional regulator n=1 Tax=Stenoxybacter acetivorans TaxID=422441 RepID=UPI0005669EF0|nr:TetR/AcrR family transcriptional regulator [Stenoxybacter acetivorans]
MNTTDTEKRTKFNRTYYRILDTALKLFDERGERNVGLNHIAEALRISSGNLHYHFKNKDEIILHLNRKFQKDLFQCFLSVIDQLPMTGDKLYLLLKNITHIMWKYRSLLLDNHSLIARHPDLLKEYSQFLNKDLLPILSIFLMHSEKANLMTIQGEGDDQSTKIFAESLYIVTKYWFDFEFTLKGKLSSISSCFRCAQYIMILMRPFVHKPILSEHDRVIALLRADEIKSIQGSHKESQEITGNHRKSQEITGNHRKSQEITGNHRKSQEITGNHRKSQEITGKFNE